MLKELQKFQRWMAWKIAPNDRGGFSKQPFNPATGGFASCNDPLTWVSYPEAQNAMDVGQYDSIGFVLGKEVGLVVVDFDKVRPSVDAPWPEWVLNEIEELDSYTEVSTSGCGLHVLVFGEIPTNTNKQQNHVEIWDSNKMFAFSGDVFQGRDTIKSHDMAGFAARVYAGNIGPEYRPKLVIEKWDSPKFRALCADNLDTVAGDRSRAVASVLCMLAGKHAFDRDKMREDFEATPLCEAWGDKWTRRSDVEISRACQYMYDHAEKPPVELEFKYDAVPGKIKDYAILPINTYDGWFPRGRVSVIGGPSAAGKSRFVINTLDHASRSETYLGHVGAGLDYIVVAADRGNLDNEETLESMGLLHLRDKFVHISALCYGDAAAAEILRVIEEHNPMPKVVFVEGADLLVEDANKKPLVAAFLKHLTNIAAHYHLAIVLSVGAPKAKAGDEYSLKRDRLPGSEVWGRMVSTVMSLQIPDDAEGQRMLYVLHRCEKTEKFELEFHGGLLRSITSESTTADPLTIWCSQQTQPFTRAEAVKAMEDADAGLRKSAVYDRIKKLLAEKKLTQEYNGSSATLKWKTPVLTSEAQALNDAVAEAIQ